MNKQSEPILKLDIDFHYGDCKILGNEQGLLLLNQALDNAIEDTTKSCVQVGMSDEIKIPIITGDEYIKPFGIVKIERNENLKFPADRQKNVEHSIVENIDKKFIQTGLMKILVYINLLFVFGVGIVTIIKWII